MSDDEDMEADARDLEREEMYRSVLGVAHFELIFMDVGVFLVLALRVEKMRRPWRQKRGTKRRSAGARRKRRLASVVTNSSSDSSSLWIPDFLSVFILSSSLNVFCLLT